MTSLILARLAAGLGLCVLYASFAYDRHVVGGVLAVAEGQAALADTSAPAASSLCVRYAFEHSPGGMRAHLNIAWRKPPIAPRTAIRTVRFSLVRSAFRWT